MEKIKSDYRTGNKMCPDGVNSLTDTINDMIGQTNCQYGSELENLTKTFSNGQSFYADDMNTFTSKVNEIIDVLNESEEQEEDVLKVGDIVVYDSIENKKIRSAANNFSLDRFPEDRYTPIGIVVEVLSNSSAKIISLPEMSWQTPDEGGGSRADLAIAQENPIEPCQAVGVYDDEFEHVIGMSQEANFPTNINTSGGELSKDGKRCYYSPISIHNAERLPSPYNEDDSINDKFFIGESPEITYYCWVRNSNPNEVVLTNKQEQNGNEVEVVYSSSGGYRFYLENGEFSDADLTMFNKKDISVRRVYISNFTNDYTRNDSLDLDVTIVYRLANGDVSGKTNTANILEHQIDIDNDEQAEGLYDREVELYANYSYRYVHFYLWSRIDEQTQKKYYLYTSNYNDSSQDGSTPERVTNNTEIWIQNNTSESFVFDYGCESNPVDAEWIQIGTVGDTNTISGGVEGFLSHFTRESGGTLYCWYRFNGETCYFLYTVNDENNITPNTKIFIQGYSSSSFVNDYGTVNKYNGSKWVEIGVIGDSEKITGGVEGFLNHFTRYGTIFWRTSTPLSNKKMRGNFPKVVTTWRFHTPGTEQGDWYLPAAGELAIAVSNYHDIQYSLKKLKSLNIQAKVAPLGSTELSTSTMYTAYGSNYAVSPTGSISNQEISGGYNTRAFTIISQLEN